MTVQGTELARALRRGQTEPERKLWAALRDRRLAGLKFRRQIPKGAYIVDFLCDEAMLIVELDGDQHASDEGVADDERRSAYFESLGYAVIRYANGAIHRDLANVMQDIFEKADARRKAPSSGLRPPSPQGEKAITATLEREA
jgi:very-short-patch-repair endonuclease